MDNKKLYWYMPISILVSCFYSLAFAPGCELISAYMRSISPRNALAV